MPATGRSASPKDKPQDAKRAPGRPTNYRPEYAEQAIACLSRGHSITGFAGEIGVSRDTLYAWAKDHPEFSDALNIARAKAAHYWETRHIAIGEGGEGNVTATIFALKNRVADEWRDRQEVTGAEGKPLIPEQTDDLTLAKSIAFLLARAAAQPQPTEK